VSEALGHDGPCPDGDGGIVMVTVNGRHMRVGANISIGVLLESLGYPARGVAVAFNRAVLSRSAWQTRLSDGARLDVFTAVTGWLTHC
jgi:sulfur carrier protein